MIPEPCRAVEFALLNMTPSGGQHSRTGIGSVPDTDSGEKVEIEITDLL